MADVKTLVLNLILPPTIITAPTSEIALPKPVIIADIIGYFTSFKSCLYILNSLMPRPKQVSRYEFLILSTAGYIFAQIIGITIKTWANIMTFSV